MVEPETAAGDAEEDMQTDECIANADRLESLCSLPADQRPPLDAACRGVLAETALTGRQRYEWRLLLPLLHSLVDEVLADYNRQQEEEEQDGPPRPPPAGFESAAALSSRLHSLLDGFDAAPFTLQRLCEVLLEPRKQYARLEKVAPAIEKLLMVTSTRWPEAQLPPAPALSEVATGVNDNPHSPYLDGRSPQVLDQVQHQALLQHQAQAMAAAQQQQQLHMQQQGRQMGGLANGLDEGPPPLEAADGEDEAGAGAGPSEAAWQLEAPPVGAAAGPPTAAAAAAAAAAGQQHQHQHQPAAGPPAISAAEVASAAQFVESALLEDPAQAAAAAGMQAAAGSVPPTPPGQQEQQQQQRQDGEGQAGALAAADVVMAGVDELQAALQASDEQEQQPRQQGPSEQEAQEPQAMELSPAAEGDAPAPASQQQPGCAAVVQQVVGQLREHLPPSLQEALLPMLLQQRWGAPMSSEAAAGSGAAEAAAAAAAAAAGTEAPLTLPAEDAPAVHAAVSAVLQQLMPAKAAAVLKGLQPLLHTEVLQQLLLH